MQAVEKITAPPFVVAPPFAAVQAVEKIVIRRNLARGGFAAVQAVEKRSAIGRE